MYVNVYMYMYRYVRVAVFGRVFLNAEYVCECVCVCVYRYVRAAPVVREQLVVLDRCSL